MRRWLPLVLALALPCAGTGPKARGAEDPKVGPGSGPGSLKEILRRAGEWVQHFADDAVFVVGEERYEQEFRTRDGASWKSEHRQVLSEIVLVRTPEEEVRAGYPWVQFRDAIEVDGTPLADHRGRLERLFERASPSAWAQASALIQESARYNIGPGIRTVNVPCFTLFFLHPRNQSRFRFEMGPFDSQANGVPLAQAVEITFRERQRPTMILSPTHQDLPATGALWIEPASGRVIKTRLEVRVDRHWTMTTDVTYGRDAGIDAWVPQAMHEHFADDDVLDCTATYSNYRRFRTSGRLIVK